MGMATTESKRRLHKKGISQTYIMDESWQVVIKVMIDFQGEHEECNVL